MAQYWNVLLTTNMNKSTLEHKMPKEILARIAMKKSCFVQFASKTSVEFWWILIYRYRTQQYMKSMTDPDF